MQFSLKTCFLAVPRGAFPSDEREHEPESPLVGNRADGDPTEYGHLADEASQEFL